ncbi:unnamed protein product [Camellia sinensis]
MAASGTKGGSSGSPVIDWQGRAVALNAGGKSSSASAFFLPLERVVRALKFLQKARDSFRDKWRVVSIPRGTLQVTFVHRGFDETRRLGLRSETEHIIVRHASLSGETGMLVVDSVVTEVAPNNLARIPKLKQVPGGPAHNLLEPGDVLVRINGDFLKMETLLDDSLDQKIKLLIERGGTPLTVDLVSTQPENCVQDLHLITPDYFLEVSGAVIHPLSYQQLYRLGLEKGTRKLLNHEERDRVLRAMDGYSYKAAAGGSLSNSLVALARLGARHVCGPPLNVAVAGSVGSDPLDGFYRV